MFECVLCFLDTFSSVPSIIRDFFSVGVFYFCSFIKFSFFFGNIIVIVLVSGYFHFQWSNYLYFQCSFFVACEPGGIFMEKNNTWHNCRVEIHLDLCLKVFIYHGCYSSDHTRVWPSIQRISNNIFSLDLLWRRWWWFNVAVVGSNV